MRMVSSPSFSISGTDSGLLSVSSSGSVSFNNWPDYESTNASANGDHIYEYLFTFTDGKSDPITLSATWEILNGNDNRATLNTTTFTILENQCAVIGEATFRKCSNRFRRRFSNSSQRFGLGDSKGYSGDGFRLVEGDTDYFRAELRHVDCGNTANYEAGDTNTSQNYISMTVQNWDDSGTTITLNVQDVNESPVWSVIDTNGDAITGRWNLTLPENQQNVAELTEATDEDGDNLIYSIGGTHADEFFVNGSTGQLSINSVPDREGVDFINDLKKVPDKTVTDGEFSLTQTNITITITDVNEPPSITSPSTYSVDENQDSAGTLTSTDEDMCGDNCSNHVFSITGGDSILFVLNSSTGELTFKANKIPDYETKNSYTFSATVTDGGGLTDTETITININDVNDNLQLSPLALPSPLMKISGK